MIQVEHLVKRYGSDAAGPRAVNDVSFTVEEGGFYTLVGPSGCGKTTTLRSIAGLERPNSGTIRLGDKVVHSSKGSVPTHAREIGMVFQNYAVWPHMNVFNNVAFPLRVAGKGKPDSAGIKKRVQRALEVVGLGGLEDRMSTQLSGGQQQRLSFARAIVREPNVLLLDEPLSNLDAKLRERMRRDLKLLHRQLGITSLFVTHDQVEALSMSDRIGVMRGGKIVQEGSPEDVYHRPVNEFVATFIGSTNLIRGVVSRVDNGVVVVDTPLGPTRGTPVQSPRVGDPASIAIRPEDLVVTPMAAADRPEADDVNRLSGRVRVGMFAGPFAELEVDVNGVHLSARSGSRSPLDWSLPVTVELPVAATRVFSGEGLAAAAELDEEASQAEREHADAEPVPTEHGVPVS
jgi:iron(III) transport system ATP-binding protein